MSSDGRSPTRVALLGGSFNPPHLGHQMICLWALSTGEVDEVWLVPCNEHAFNKGLCPFEHRLEMCRRATLPFRPELVHVDSVERDIGGRSRTLVTLQHLMERHPAHAFRLLIGADILQEADAWYRFDEVKRLAPLLVIGRDGYPSPTGAPLLPDISSTKIRSALATGESVSQWVPAAVLRYISELGLYRDAGLP
ncbi:MAG: nicotinate (nicotinamide) nucleotide adenylyltransferase [Deltaproteobacteria bacterium]|nr:nicotinate (nicotinamide) nucleotide adenylyltransferase [Deltaproteobacteria bacterium]